MIPKGESRIRKTSCDNMKIERNGDQDKSHSALASQQYSALWGEGQEME
jgi:hypothetical protein